MQTVRRTCAQACACLLAILTWPVVAAPVNGSRAPNPPHTLQQQRAAFRAAYAAARDGQDWRGLAAGLKDYPLYPYLEAAALEHNIKTAAPARVEAYLEHYPGMIPAHDLRNRELRWLAEQKDWNAFRKFYRQGLGDALTCDALEAKLAEGKPLDFARDLGALWQRTSLPSACKPVLAAAFDQGLLTPTRVWARIERAADAGNAATIEQSAAWLTDGSAAAAKRLAEAIRAPATFLKKASKFANTERNRQAASLALIRVARRNSAQALKLWPALSKRFTFDSTQRDHVLAALALYNAVDFGPAALARLANLPTAAQTDATREWRVRVAVAEGNWKAAEAAIRALTPREMRHDVWRYWQARVAQKLGHSATARKEYASLAREATFYGFLAADRAGLPYSICPASLPVKPSVDQEVETIPGFARAFEFFALGMLGHARREWNVAFPDLTPLQQRQAAALASRRGWYDRAVFAFAKSGDLHYYALRFPLADKERVLKAARDAGIDPAWAFAIIRAETAWQTDAQSGANARGLMQLLPATASQVARNNGLPYRGAASLYEPGINIPLGVHYLAHLAAQFDSNQWLATAAYNAGPGNARRWVNARGELDPETFILTIPFSETREYVTRVMSFATIYGWRLHGDPVSVSSRLAAIGSSPGTGSDPAHKQVVCRVPDTASAAPAKAPPASVSRRSAAP